MNEGEHKEHYSKILKIVVMLLILLLGGALFYSYAEKWSYLDALYFSVSTVTTVGYGDLVPQTTLGKSFTILYMLIGVAVALYGLRLIAIHFMEIREEYHLKSLLKERYVKKK